jgi:hypothetical protein
MAQLDGRGSAIDIAPGYRIAAPGLVGTATARNRRAPGSGDRGPELITAAFDRVAVAAGLREVMNIDLDVQQVPPPQSAPQMRTVTGEDALVLETPDLGPDVGQVVLAVDEAGAVTWNFPETPTRDVEPPTQRGAGGSKRFVIRRTTPVAAEGAAADRGLFGAIGRKFLKVLIYPIADAVLGPVSEHFANKWETSQRPYKLRSFRPTDFRVPALAPLTGPEWEHLAGGRALLFVHGTFATSHSGFQNLPDETMAELHRRYDGRVFAFDHFTLSHSPQENVQEFAARMPDGIKVEVDVVTHSRGGLVTRALAGELEGVAVPGLTVERAVFVATPNHGTALADAENIVAFIDRYTTILNLAPPGPLEVISEILEVIVTVVKVVGHAVLNGLPGLAAMAPAGEFIKSINAGPAPSAEYYALAANFSPQPGPLWSLVKERVANGVIDRIFSDAANDMVVPTLGVSQGSADPVFPIADDRAFVFPDSAGVQHSSFFGNAETSRRLLTWLTA